MRVLHVSTYDNHGGAARAAFRLLNGLKSECDVRMVVKNKGSGNPLVVQATGKHWTLKQKIGHHVYKLLKRPSYGQIPPSFSLPAEDFCSADLAEAPAGARPGR